MTKKNVTKVIDWFIEVPNQRDELNYEQLPAVGGGDPPQCTDKRVNNHRPV